MRKAAANCPALPHMRRRRDGLLVWIRSTSARRHPAVARPVLAAKVAEDSLAVSIAAEVSGFGVDTSIVVPGSFTTGPSHYAHAGHPADEATAKEYADLYGGAMEALLARQAEPAPADADHGEVARRVAALVDLTKGQRPFRVYIDPAQDGAEEVFRIGDRIRRDFYRAVGDEELLRPAT